MIRLWERTKGGLRGKNYEEKVECVKGPWRLSRYFFFSLNQRLQQSELSVGRSSRGRTVLGKFSLQRTLCFVVKTGRRRLRHVTSERIGHFSLYAPINVNPGRLKVHYARAVGNLNRIFFWTCGIRAWSFPGF